ncbi:MAG: carbohydrate ABC transporter permease [Acidimicrobiales bacterium]
MSAATASPAVFEAVASRPIAARVVRDGGGRTRRRRATGVGGGRAARFAAFVLGTVWLVIVLLPIYYMVLASFRTQGQYLSGNPWLPTGGLSLSSYGTVFSATGLGIDFRNSAILTLATIIIVVLCSLGAAYRIVRRASHFAAVSFRLILFGLAVPIQAIIIPIFIIVVKMHLYDTLIAVILAASASLIAVAVLLMVNYVRAIPRELFDAMTVDGAGEWTVFARLVWPMARPVLAVVSIFAGLGAWNNFLLPLILTQSNANSVLPVGLYKVASTSQYGIDVPVVMAAVLLSVLPLVLLYFGLRRQFVQGLGGFAIR